MLIKFHKNIHSKFVYKSLGAICAFAVISACDQNPENRQNDKKDTKNDSINVGPSNDSINVGPSDDSINVGPSDEYLHVLQSRANKRNENNDVKIVKNLKEVHNVNDFYYFLLPSTGNYKKSSFKKDLAEYLNGNVKISPGQKAFGKFDINNENDFDSVIIICRLLQERSEYKDLKFT